MKRLAVLVLSAASTGCWLFASLSDEDADAGNVADAANDTAAQVDASDAAASPIALVQVTGTDTFQDASTPLSTSFDASVRAGDMLIAAVGGITSAPSSMRDSMSNVYHLAVADQESAIYFALTGDGGDITVEADFPVATSGALTILEYSGVDLISPLDQIASASALDGSVLASGNKTTVFPRELIFGYASVANNSMAGSGFISVSDQTGNTSEYELVDATGSYGVTFTQSPPGGWTALMATFRGVGQ